MTRTHAHPVVHLSACRTWQRAQAQSQHETALPKGAEVEKGSPSSARTWGTLHISKDEQIA